MKQKKPDWLKVKLPFNRYVINTNQAVKGLSTICKSALCPNIGECYSRGTATFLILGKVCTRNCRFCAVCNGEPEKTDIAEPAKIAEAVSTLSLKYVVITSVTRDDLDDGGADIFCSTVKEIRKITPDCGIEVLIPDFQGSFSPLEKIIQQKPDVIAHNMETVERLYPQVRNGAKYKRSLQVIENIRNSTTSIKTKSGIMVGMGEEKNEIINLMKHLLDAGCDILTIGQYLQPTKKHYPVQSYIHPDEFKELKETGEVLGFAHVESAPLVRSSYHAGSYS